MKTSTLPTLARQAPGQPLRRRWPRWLVLNTTALIVASLLLRAEHLGNIAGVNGDEAWSGVQALRLLGGEPVDWWTPNGNLINLFFLLPTAVLHVFVPPSFALLRITSLVSGLLALVANYLLCRRAFSQRTAVVSTCLLALLPINVAYSRFAWDASQSLLVTLFILYLPLIACRRARGRAMVPAGGLAAQAAAIWVHPTNVFAAPLLVIPMLYRARRRIGERLENTAVAWRTGTLAALVAVSAAVVYGAWHGLGTALSRLHGPSELTAFGVNYLRLLSGTTIYRYIAGIDAPEVSSTAFGYVSPLSDSAFALLALVALLGLYRRLSQRPTAGDESLVLGWLVMLAGFFLVAGPTALAAHYERYGICLIAPAALVLARGLTWWLEQSRARRKQFRAGLSVAAWLWPVCFYCGYFALIEQTGGWSHPTFRTAAVEPKQAALRFIVEHRGENQRGEKAPAVIVCGEYWNYWPLDYLGRGQDNVRTWTWDAWLEAKGFSNTTEVENTWFVEFAGSAAESEVRRRLEKAGLKYQSAIVYDYGNREFLVILGPAEKFSQNY